MATFKDLEPVIYTRIMRFLPSVQAILFLALSCRPALKAFKEEQAAVLCRYLLDFFDANLYEAINLVKDVKFGRGLTVIHNRDDLPFGNENSLFSAWSWRVQQFSEHLFATTDRSRDEIVTQWLRGQLTPGCFDRSTVSRLCRLATTLDVLLGQYWVFAQGVAQGKLLVLARGAPLGRPGTFFGPDFPSRSERHRLVRAFLRYEMMCRWFSIPYWTILINTVTRKDLPRPQAIARLESFARNGFNTERFLLLLEEDEAERILAVGAFVRAQWRAFLASVRRMFEKNALEASERVARAAAEALEDPKEEPCPLSSFFDTPRINTSGKTTYDVQYLLGRPQASGPAGGPANGVETTWIDNVAAGFGLVLVKRFLKADSKKFRDSLRTLIAVVNPSLDAFEKTTGYKPIFMHTRSFPVLPHHAPMVAINAGQGKVIIKRNSDDAASMSDLPDLDRAKMRSLGYLFWDVARLQTPRYKELRADWLTVPSRPPHEPGAFEQLAPHDVWRSAVVPSSEYDRLIGYVWAENPAGAVSRDTNSFPSADQRPESQRKTQHSFPDKPQCSINRQIAANPSTSQNSKSHHVRCDVEGQDQTHYNQGSSQIFLPVAITSGDKQCALDNSAGGEEAKKGPLSVRYGKIEVVAAAVGEEDETEAEDQAVDAQGACPERISVLGGRSLMPRSGTQPSTHALLTITIQPYCSQMPQLCQMTETSHHRGDVRPPLQRRQHSLADEFTGRRGRRSSKFLTRFSGGNAVGLWDRRRGALDCSPCGDTDLGFVHDDADVKQPVYDPSFPGLQRYYFKTPLKMTMFPEPKLTDVRRKFKNLLLKVRQSVLVHNHIVRVIFGNAGAFRKSSASRLQPQSGCASFLHVQPHFIPRPNFSFQTYVSNSVAGQRRFFFLFTEIANFNALAKMASTSFLVAPFPPSASHLERLPVELTDNILRLTSVPTKRILSNPAHHIVGSPPYRRHSVADILSLSLASKALYSRAVVHLYHSVLLEDINGHQFALFLRTLAENPHLRPLVRRLALYNIHDDFNPVSITHIRRESNSIYYALQREGAIPYAELKILLPLARDFSGAHHYRCRVSDLKVMDGLHQTILLCLPELNKLTLARPLSLRFFATNLDKRRFPENSLDLIPDTFLPRLTDITLDASLVPSNSQLGKISVVDEVMAVVPITCHRPLLKLRILGLDADPWSSHAKVRASPEGFMPVRHLHINQMRLDYRDVRGLISQMPHLETLHLQRVFLGGPLTYSWRQIPYAHSRPNDQYTLRDLLKPVATSLRSLDIDLRLLSEANYIIYGKNRRVSTLKYMTALRHLTITADAIVGRLFLPSKVSKVKLSEYFPRELETLTIREAVHVNRDYPPLHVLTPGYINTTRAEAMFLLLDKIADVFIEKKAKSNRRQCLRKVTLSGQYSTELGKLAHWSRRQSAMKKVWEVMEEDGRYRLEKIRDKFGQAGIEFEVEEEPSLDLDVDF
ncbi:hypothetical protein V8F20_001886 [Naviculisporaceae sp. PSN 640]